MNTAKLLILIALLSSPLNCRADTDFKTVLKTPKLLPKERFGYNTMINGNFCTAKVTADPLANDFNVGYELVTIFPIKTSSNKSCFAVFIAENGVGHLQSISDNLGHKLPPSSTLRPWDQRVSYVTKNRTLEKLNSIEASKLFGKPRPYRSYVTYDVESDPVSPQENNIYHLDLLFDNAGVIEKYRIRGIGIVKPQWVSS